MTDRYSKSVLDLSGAQLAEILRETDAFICAAGFEERAKRIPLVANVLWNPVVIAFKNGPKENDTSFEAMQARFGPTPGFGVCELDLANPGGFEASFERSLRQLTNLTHGNVLLDISGLPNFAICIATMKIRTVLPFAGLTLLYTEAEEYFPQESDFVTMKRRAVRDKSILFPNFMSDKAVNTFIPSMFSGVTLGHNDTCLVIFVGYEPHRTNCVVDATNPSRLVMVYGEPERVDLRWRLDLSRVMHSRLDRQFTKTEEVTSTSEVAPSLDLLLEYYGYLYDDCVLSVCPSNSKLQAVAAALAWETYPDIQLCFAVPATYLAKSFSSRFRATFVIELGRPPQTKRFLG
jgi:hypothetical protein